MRKKSIVLFTAISLLLVTNLMAQTKNYTAAWKKVSALQKKGLTRSILKEVDQIYLQALGEKNEPQQIKAALYQLEYRKQLDEDGDEKNLLYGDTLIKKSTGVSRQILQSILAEQYWDYLQNNRYQIYGRTELATTKSKDPATWDFRKFHETIGQLYKASLMDPKKLQSVKVESFLAILDEGKNTRQLRPSLYDLLAHRALDYFTTDESDLVQPANRFELNDPVALGDAISFAQAHFITEDSTSLHYAALQIFQELTRFHLKDANPDALIDLELKRLPFVRQHAAFKEIDRHYENALEKLAEQYGSSPIATTALYLLANQWEEKGNEHLADSSNRMAKVKALEYCEMAVKRFPESEGGINAYNTMMQLKTPSISMETETVNIPLVPFRFLLQYKNATQIHFRLLKINPEKEHSYLQLDNVKKCKYLASLPVVQTWQEQLPNPGDLREHAVEVKVDGLPPGKYVLQSSLLATFDTTENLMSHQVVNVSNIGVIHQNDDFFVLNRETGEPIAAATVQVYESIYREQTRKYEWLAKEKYTTNPNGFFQLKPSKEWRQFKLAIYTAHDSLLMQDEVYQQGIPYISEYNNNQAITFFFTDRSIYRPGQTVYFKGIVLKGDDQKVLLKNARFPISLYDANGQKKQTVELTTNDFGSFHGSFVLPMGGLNGSFSIHNDSTRHETSFRVEEYKRPKFQVTLPAPSGTYRLNDRVTVTGSAQAFAGNAIGGAKLTYTVKRKINYPIWLRNDYSFEKRFPGFRGEETVIATGTSITKADGHFDIVFEALPDPKVPQTNQPVFYFAVSVDVTDLNGETRSALTSIKVAYQQLQIQLEVPEQQSLESFQQIVLQTKNLNDGFEKASVTLQLHELQSPNRFLRDRLWEAPDQFLYTKDEFHRYFPYDVYNKEDQKSHWPLGRLVLDKTDSTTTDGKWKIDAKGLQPGWYKLVATAHDKDGALVTAEQYIELTSATSPTTKPIAFAYDQPSYQPGDTLRYQFKTGLGSIWIINKESTLKGASAYQFGRYSGTNNHRQIQVDESMRGGWGWQYVFMKNNRVYSGSEMAPIPWTNKELQISYSSFRNLLQPGQPETWSLTINNDKALPAMAEVMTGMYDASLDQFAPHQWNKLTLWDNLILGGDWSSLGFNEQESLISNFLPYRYKKVKEHLFDRILSALGNNYRILNRYDYAYSEFKGRAAKLSFAAPSVELDEKEAIQSPIYDSLGNISTYKKAPKKNNGGSNNFNNNIPIRKDFKETAFFFPELRIDAAGHLSFQFTMPEALTQWKLMTFAHTFDLASGYLEKTTVTQKPLMVQPNAPRFFREGDQMEFSAKIANLTDSELTGTVRLELLDAATLQQVDGWFNNVFPQQYFTVAAKQSSVVKFPIQVPFQFSSALTYRIVAQSGLYSDGEEMAIPVLTNRQLVTETLPLHLRQSDTARFRFEKLLHSGESPTATNHALTVEFSSNPTWYAVQALPYLMEFPQECAEQTFNRFYANVLASHITQHQPAIEQLFQQWKNVDTAALQSPLQQNEELKSTLLEETPWVMEAKNESQQKKNLALLFDKEKVEASGKSALERLKALQRSDGAMPWFAGGYDNRYITQYILCGIGHLQQLRVLKSLSAETRETLDNIVQQGLPYLDEEMKKEYDALRKNKIAITKYTPSFEQIQYLYLRSFFKEKSIKAVDLKAFQYFFGQAKKHWLMLPKYQQGMVALILNRYGETTTAKAILKSLKETAIYQEELGMYWKEWTTPGYLRSEAPIESQALMIEAFAEIEKDEALVNELKTWLLLQKQTQHWPSTIATAEACYALLLQGSNGLVQAQPVTVQLGDGAPMGKSNPLEAGTGYWKTSIPGEKVTPQMGEVKVMRAAKKSGQPVTPSWGAVYWQYFEDMDKITQAGGSLQLRRQLLVNRQTDKGSVLELLGDGATLKVGDQVTVRLVVKSDRDMEFLHLKDVRASCMEPEEVLSAYHWQGGLGYYQSTKDASTNFFFDVLPRGTHVLEYAVRITHAGQFSNGIGSIQCLYAPGFNSHSEGNRMLVEP